MSDGSAVVQVKGHSLRQNFVVFEELYGEAVATRIAGHFCPEFRQLILEARLLPSGWYPIDWANDMYRAAAQELPNELDLPEKVGRLGAQKDMQGIYGFLARLISPEICIRQAPRILGTFFKGPEIRSELLGDQYVQLVFSRCPGLERSVWRESLAGAAYIFETAGAKSPQLQLVEGGNERVSTTRVDVRWKL